MKPSAEADSRPTSGRLIVSDGKREYVPQGYSQKAQAAQPKRASRDVDSYASPKAKSKSNDWFDESSSYNSFGSDSAAGASRPARSSNSGDVNPQVEADRLDSERILNELLMDLDTGDSLRGSSSGNEREVDYFDFSMDSEDLKLRQQASVTGRAPSKAAGSSGRTIAPQMEDFVSFELYLDALVHHERSSIGGAGSSTYMDGGSSRKGSSYNSRSGGDSDQRGGSSSSRDFDSLDDNLVAFLGGEDEDDSSSKAKKAKAKNPQDSWGSKEGDKTPVRSWSPKKVEPVAAVVAPVDDLSSFLDSLEDSNVLPSKNKAPATVKKEEVKVAAPSSPIVAESQGSSEGLSSLSVKDLRDKLREKGLPISGNKAALVSRLST